MWRYLNVLLVHLISLFCGHSNGEIVGWQGPLVGLDKCFLILQVVHNYNLIFLSHNSPHFSAWTKCHREDINLTSQIYQMHHQSTGQLVIDIICNISGSFGALVWYLSWRRYKPPTHAWLLLRPLLIRHYMPVYLSCSCSMCLRNWRGMFQRRVPKFTS